MLQYFYVTPECLMKGQRASCCQADPLPDPERLAVISASVQHPLAVATKHASVSGCCFGMCNLYPLPCLLLCVCVYSMYVLIKASLHLDVSHLTCSAGIM